MRFIIGLLFTCATTPAAADSLGLTGANVTLSYTQDEAQDWQFSAAVAALNVNITAIHGLQTGLTFADTENGGIGTLDAHLFMAPTPAAKYGLFATLSDVDGRALRWGTLGAEAMLSLTPQTTADVRTGIGYSDDGLDFVFAGAGLTHALGEALTLSARLDLTDFDEPGLHALSHEASLTAQYRPTGSGWSAFASLTTSGLTGPDAMDPETRIGLGVSFDIGQTGGTAPTERLFSTNDPVAPLIRRGLW